MKLYDLTLSGNCYKVRLFLSLIGKEAELVPVDLLAGEHKRPAFLAINPRGLLPALEDGELRLADSQAILVYLARRYADERWYPLDAISQGRVVSWLSFAANEVSQGLATARLGKLFKRPIDHATAHVKANSALSLLDAHLAHHQWLAETAAPTIADVAVYPYTALAGDGDVDLSPHVHIKAWFSRVRELSGYIGMPGL